MNSLAGMICTALAPRPAATDRSTRSFRNSTASSNLGWAEKITSACRAAKLRPSGESPAWNRTVRRLPRVPDPLGRLHEGLGVLVPVGVVQVSAAAEVRSGPGVVSGHDVP